MKQTIWAFYMSLLLVFITGACNDPTVIGDDLVQDDISNIKTTDTLSIQSELLKVDSVETFTPIIASQSNRFLIGNVSDEIYGNVEASLYFQFAPFNASLLDSATFTNITFDSIELDLVYDNTLTYGDITEPFDVEVFRVVEDINAEERLYSNQGFEVDPIPLGGVYNLLPSPTEGEVIRVDTTEDVNGSDSLVYIRDTPRLKIKLDNSFAMELLDQSLINDSTYQNTEAFISMFKGLKVAVTSPSKSYIGFDMNTSRLNVTYVRDTLGRTQSYSAGSFQAKTSHYQNDYTGSLAGAILDNPKVAGDTLLPLQGLAGTEAVIKFPTVDQLGLVGVNQAVLEITVAYPAGLDTLTYPISGRLGAFISGEDGERNVTQEFGISIGGGSVGFFGGTVVEVTEDGMVLDKISMNITSVIQDFVKNGLGTGDNELFIEIFGHEKTPSRIVLYGANHPTYPMKLTLTYTEP